MTEATFGAGDLSPRPLSPSTPSVGDIQNAPASDAFAQLGLAPELLRAVADLGFTEPTEVQRQAIALALPSEIGTDEASVAAASDDADAAFDLMVSSRTGSGKTAAFLLPLLQRLLAQQQCAEALARAATEQAAADALLRGEASPKKPRRRNPTDPRNFRAAEPGALVLCPTRELAQQVAHDAIALVR
ncbi:MAG: DEAD/DEAH box helicase, partial [Proteobacteria bacterium]|nr:DEAD/DEAH box helicase [Pseudomonadota bacterium]